MDAPVTGCKPAQSTAPSRYGSLHNGCQQQEGKIVRISTDSGIRRSNTGRCDQDVFPHTGQDSRSPPHASPPPISKLTCRSGWLTLCTHLESGKDGGMRRVEFYCDELTHWEFGVAMDRSGIELKLGWRACGIDWTR